MEVQLYQRSQLPPSRIGAVKPLDIPEISPFEAGAEIGSSIIQQIRATRAGNEQSEYLGAVATAQERAATQIADNPGMPFEDMDKIQKQMMTEIDQAGKNLQLPESKLYARNFKLRNRLLIEEKFNTQKEAILTGHELDRARINEDILIATRDKPGLVKLFRGTDTEKGLSGTLYDPEVAEAMLAMGLLKIDALQAKFDEEQLINSELASARAVYDQTQDLTKTLDVIRDSEIIPEDRKQELQSDLVTEVGYRKAIEDEELEIQRESDRDVISKAMADPNVLTTIDNSSLDENEQHTWRERARAEAERRANGEEIITDDAVRTELYNDIMGILSLSKTKKEVLEKAKAARFDPKKPTLSETDYSKIETAIHAQYEQAYGQGMGKVSRHAEGLLLNPDSLGYIKNAPIRYKILGDFNEAWLRWIASKGDALKVSDIYPEGRRMAATFQISDEEAERQEVEMNKRLREREATVWPKMPTDKNILEAAKKVAGETTREELPQPKTKEEYDKLKSGTKYIDPEGVERTKK